MSAASSPSIDKPRAPALIDRGDAASQIAPAERKPVAGIEDVRFIGSLNGRYVLASRESQEAGIKVFACRISSITPRRAVFAAPVSGARGERVTAQIEHLGLLNLRLEERVEFGFSALIDAAGEERERLAARIEWAKKRVLNSCADHREHRRVTPRNPRSRLLLHDGTQLDCFLLDISRTGAAISADIAPAIGTPLGVGRLIGRVVRHLDVGFAVQFIEQQDEAAVEVLLAPDQAASSSS
jgi:hypothetical protein